MKIIAMIPARYAATRFPAKLMQMLGNKPVIRYTYDAVKNTGLFDEVIVVTDSPVIFEEIVHNGGAAIMSEQEHQSGSDRIAEAAAGIDADVIINVQGDEPFIQKEPLERLVNLFKDPTVKVGSLMRPVKDKEELQRNSAVKVVTDKLDNALYFSRSVIPFVADKEVSITHYLHIGVYGFRKETLLAFTQWPMSVLEKTEKLEQLRYLENGVPIRMAEVDFLSVAIDTPEDLETAKTML